MSVQSMPHDPAREMTGFAIGLLAVVLFAASAPFTRMALVDYSPWLITFGRAAIATVGAIITLVVSGRRLKREHVLPAFLAGLLLVVIFPATMGLAFQTIPSSHGGVIMGILPLMTAVFAALIDHDRPSPLFWVCALGGGLIVVAFALREGGFAFQTGDLWLFFGSPLCSLGYVISAKLSRHMPGWEVICWSLVLTAPISFLGTWYSWAPDDAQAAWSSVGALAYLGLVSMFAAYFFWNIGLAMGGIARVGQIQLLQTFFTLGLSALLLGEHIGWDTVGFASAVVILIAIARQAPIKKRGQ